MKERKIFERLIDLCQAAGNDQTLRKALARLTKSAGFRWFAYFHAHSTDNYAISNYPPEWQELYFARSYMILDPVITAAKRGTQVFRWSIDAARSRASEELRCFYTEAAGFDLKSGLSVSVSTGFGRTAVVTFASDSHAEPDGRLSGEVAALGATAAAYLHAKIGQADRWPKASRAITLNCNEVACLRLAAEGKSMPEIAAILEMRYGTVRFHIDTAKAKLGVVKLSQATAAAARRSII